MYDVELARVILLQIYRTLQTIQRRFVPITSPDDFLTSDAGLEKLDAICVQLIAIGESDKNLDKVTTGSLLILYPQVEWKQVMGMRDVLSHHYFDLDVELIFSVCKSHIPNMSNVVRHMLLDLGASTVHPGQTNE